MVEIIELEKGVIIWLHRKRVGIERHASLLLKCRAKYWSILGYLLLALINKLNWSNILFQQMIKKILRFSANIFVHKIFLNTQKSGRRYTSICWRKKNLVWPSISIFYIRFWTTQYPFRYSANAFMKDFLNIYFIIIKIVLKKSKNISLKAENSSHSTKCIVFFETNQILKYIFN